MNPGCRRRRSLYIRWSTRSNLNAFMTVDSRQERKFYLDLRLLGVKRKDLRRRLKARIRHTDAVLASDQASELRRAIFIGLGAERELRPTLRRDFSPYDRQPRLGMNFDQNTGSL